MRIVEIGDKFGKLTVIEIDGNNITCQCECGNIITRKSYKLLAKTKPVRSCGCLRLERLHELETVHGHSGGLFVGARTKLYRTWSNMKTRCYNPNVRSYEDYGAKGIKVCDEWKDNFVCFQKWAEANGYSEQDKSLTIDRIDPLGDYCPSNCRWISNSENFSRAHEVACWGRNLITGEYVEFVNIRKFANSRGLSYSCIDRVLHHRNHTHKHWVFGYLN